MCLFPEVNIFIALHHGSNLIVFKNQSMYTTVNREIFVMVLFWPILAPKYEVPKLSTPKYVTLQKLTAKIEHCLNIFLYFYSLVCTFLSYFFTGKSSTLMKTLQY